jgi:hypothetical protein
VSAQPSEPSKPAGLDRAAIAAWTRRSRAASGRGPKIDPATLAKLVTLALAGNDSGGPGSSPGRCLTIPPPQTTKGRSHHAAFG